MQEGLIPGRLNGRLALSTKWHILCATGLPAEVQVSVVIELGSKQSYVKVSERQYDLASVMATSPDGDPTCRSNKYPNLAIWAMWRPPAPR